MESKTKKKILFWIDSSGLSQFGISNFLQNQINDDFYAIFDVNKQRKFYSEQKIVNFKKSWFFRDHISKTSTFNEKYLKNIEEKYDMNFWEYVFADPIFFQHNQYHKFQYDEILVLLEQFCKFFENVLDEITPDFLIMRPTDHLENILLHKICKNKGIKILTINFSRLWYLYFISDNSEKIEPSIDHDIFDSKSFDDYQNLLEWYPKQQENARNQFKISKYKKIKTMFTFLSLINSKNYQNHFSHKGRTTRRVFSTQLVNMIKSYKRQNFINKNLIYAPNFQAPFVYFPLHYQPERTTLILSPYYTNQLEVINSISKALPIEYKLYVKEHPMQINQGWRDIKFYQNLIDIPNVQFLHPSVSSLDLIKHCSLVISITGTASLEAAFYQKPSIVFADTIFSKLSSVHRLETIEELPHTIRTSLKNQVQINDINKFVDFVQKNSFEFKDGQTFVQRFKDYFQYGGLVKDVEISIPKMKNFLKANSSFFKKLTSELLKKINEDKNI